MQNLDKKLETVVAAWEAALPDAEPTTEFLMGRYQAAKLVQLYEEVTRILKQLPLSHDKVRLVPGCIVWYHDFEYLRYHGRIIMVSQDAVKLTYGGFAMWLPGEMVFSSQMALEEYILSLRGEEYLGSLNGMGRVELGWKEE